MKSGLSWTPQFCMDEDPYEDIVWERRHVVVREGEHIVFQQKNVEVPSTWSDLALSQVCQKYFRGKVDENGTPREGRETSVREIVERVVNTNADWAGYFDATGEPWHNRPKKTIQDPKEAYFNSHASWLAWKNDLKWLLIHQCMAFNSPVWFNVGREAYPQTAACFINRMEDWILGSGDGDGETEVEPEDLMDHHGLAAAQVKEILIFSNGSGSGIDLSRIRSKREFLSGGGKPSGPIAKPGGRPTFAEGLDIWASTIHSGGKTRRAAKMLLLDVDHPDILDFIRIKAWQEEHVVKSLVASGSSTKMDDYAYSQAWHQNSNLSVSVNRRFMEAVEDRETWDLVSRTHHHLEDLPIGTTMLGTEGRVMETVKAYDLFEEIGRSAWRCGDPGLRFHDTINDWNTCADTEEIKCCNPCAEYNFLDDTSCNLASLNLKRFLVDGVFDVVKYVQAVRATAIAMDVWISNSRFPTRRIRDRTAMYRTLGLGHANLGGLFMQMGLPYDSDDARELAAMLTSLLTATTYATSADMASAIGPFSAFGANRKSCTDVMKKHHLAHLNLDANTIWAKTDWYRNASRIAGTYWASIVQTCEEGRGIRNAQATVMAPTGTIAFLMDCDTTGIEPELALVKWKALAGGGYLPIFSKIDGVLTSLGYEGETLKQIHDHLAAKKSIRLCPALKPEHHEIFRTSFPPIDDPEFSLPWLAHVEMMAAIQPFVSGAISKTVNCPEETTVEDIMGIYQTAYHAGLKSIAIYRDGSKFTQAVSTREYEKDQEDQDDPDENLMAELESKIAVLEAQVSELAKRQGRHKLDRNVVTGRTKFIIDGNKGFVHIGFFSDTWQIAEIFMRFSKRGSTMDGMLDAICIAYSKLLQYGMDPQELIDDLEWTQFQPYGPILADPDVKTCTSPLDYLAKKVRAIRERVHDEESYLRTYRADSSGLPKETVTPVVSAEPAVVRKLGRSCPKCGTSPILVERNCIKCMFCGYDEGGCFA